ncbi:MAG: DUF378 domain-containing protein [Nanoarchaeota archaeon]
MKKLSGLEWIVTVLVVVGALNWGLLAINPGWNVVLNLFGEGTLARLVYGLVGLSGLYKIYWLWQ